MKTVFQLSGGRDSLACLFVMEPFWDGMTVAWCDGGDSAPELVALMAKVEKLVPHFVRVPGKVKQTREQQGDPTDKTWIGCCMASVWTPMADWVRENNTRWLIRGTRSVDPVPFPVPGLAVAGITYLLPLWDSSDSDCAGLLTVAKERGLAPVYPHDCLHCPVTRICDRPEMRNVA